jgi:hypothetical protein
MQLLNAETVRKFAIPNCSIPVTSGTIWKKSFPATLAIGHMQVKRLIYIVILTQKKYI